MVDDYELIASVLRKFSEGYFHLHHEEGWDDDPGGWRLTIDNGIELTDEEYEAVQRALRIDGEA